jgi:hypothetical protein
LKLALRHAPRPLLARVLGAGISLALLPACTGWRVPKPPGGPVPEDEMIEVPYPPPPAHVEVVPEKKKDGDVWIDGQWDWDGADWQWTEGSWMTPPPNAYFTPWKAERKKDGRLFFASAAWRAPDGKPLMIRPRKGDCGPQPRTPGAGEVAKR